MMETSQLSRMHPAETRGAATSAAKAPADTPESDAFDRRLDDQMAQARSAEKAAAEPDSTEKTDKKQSTEQPDGERAGSGSDSAAAPDESEIAPAESSAEQPRLAIDVTESGPQAQAEDSTGEAAAPAVRQAAVDLDTADETPVEDADLPPEGKTLPPAGDEGVNTAPASAAVMATPRQVKTDGTEGTQSVRPEGQLGDGARQQQHSRPVSAGIPQQAVIASSVNATDGADFVLPEGDLQGKAGGKTADADIEALLSRGRASAIMSVASAASNQQQVPLTTSLGGLHLHPGFAADGPMSASPANPFPTTLSSSLGTPVQNPAWSQGVAERVAWMVQGQFQTAELKLNPSNLGPLEIRLSVDDNRTSITFVTQHAPVRDALDAAMPRLREMLESQGLDLSDVNVSDSGVQGHQQQSADSQSAGRGGVADPGSGESTGDEALMQESLVQVDRATGVSIYA